MCRLVKCAEMRDVGGHVREVWSMIGEAWLGILTWFALCVCVGVVVHDYEQLATTLHKMYVCVYVHTPVCITFSFQCSLCTYQKQSESVYSCRFIRKYVFVYVYT